MTITPGSFDHQTARGIVGDTEARRIEAKARADADARKFDPPAIEGDTYWALTYSEMQRAVYVEQHRKRVARIARKRSR